MGGGSIYTEAAGRHLDIKTSFNFLYSSPGNVYPSILKENSPHNWKVIYISFSFVHGRPFTHTSFRKVSVWLPPYTQKLGHPTWKDAKEIKGAMWASLAVLGSKGHT